MTGNRARSLAAVARKLPAGRGLLRDFLGLSVLMAVLATAAALIWGVSPWPPFAAAEISLAAANGGIVAVRVLVRRRKR